MALGAGLIGKDLRLGTAFLGVVSACVSSKPRPLKRGGYRNRSGYNGARVQRPIKGTDLGATRDLV